MARAFTSNEGLGGSEIPRDSVSLFLREYSSAARLNVFFGRRHCCFGTCDGSFA